MTLDVLPTIGCLGIFLYEVFGMMFLVQDRYACGNDSDSPLWIFAVAAMIAGNYLLVFNCPICLEQESAEHSFLINICSMAISGVMCIWGTFLIPTGHVCNAMKTTGLWVWIQMFYFATIVCFVANTTSAYYAAPHFDHSARRANTISKALAHLPRTNRTQSRSQSRSASASTIRVIQAGDLIIHQGANSNSKDVETGGETVAIAHDVINPLLKVNLRLGSREETEAKL
jgi:hypothetical protein